MKTETYERIGKETIPTLTFNIETDMEQDDDIISQLETATRLGNGYHSKVNIYFHSDQGPKLVSTTIWATGTKFICLKGGMWIPIASIKHTEID